MLRQDYTGRHNEVVKCLPLYTPVKNHFECKTLLVCSINNSDTQKALLSFIGVF